MKRYIPVEVTDFAHAALIACLAALAAGAVAGEPLSIAFFPVCLTLYLGYLLLLARRRPHTARTTRARELYQQLQHQIRTMRPDEVYRLPLDGSVLLARNTPRRGLQREIELPFCTLGGVLSISRFVHHPARDGAPGFHSHEVITLEREPLVRVQFSGVQRGADGEVVFSRRGAIEGWKADLFSGRTGLGWATEAELEELLRQLREAEPSA